MSIESEYWKISIQQTSDYTLIRQNKFNRNYSFEQNMDGWLSPDSQLSEGFATQI
jgi:hypothetical protein